jgi:hypothetical protein
MNSRKNLHVMPNSHAYKIIWANDTDGGALEAVGVEYLSLDSETGAASSSKTIVCIFD